jgi:hypothetical protein
LTSHIRLDKAEVAGSSRASPINLADAAVPLRVQSSLPARGLRGALSGDVRAIRRQNRRFSDRALARPGASVHVVLARSFEPSYTRMGSMISRWRDGLQ